MYSEKDQVIALAGIVQSAKLVNQIATTGLVDSYAVETSINSVLMLDSASVESVYGDIHGLNTGLKQLIDQLSGTASANRDITRYVLSLLYLEGRLRKKPDTLNSLKSGIEFASSQVKHFSLLHTNVLSSLASLYVKTISDLGPKILVNGEKKFLSQEDNIFKIRSLLLAGIRSAVLWRQCNGSKWQLLFGRAKILSSAKELLQQKSEKEFLH
jgi:high frequency lysogenization protein